jgi:HEAT repeat protein
MSPSLILALHGLLFLLLFSVSLFGFIIIRRVVQMRKRVSFSRLYEHVETDILESMSRLSPLFSLEVARRHRTHPAVLTQALLDYGDIILGEGRDQLRIIFNHSLRDHCLKHLRSRRTARRLQSVRLFIIFFDPAESGFLLRLLDDKPIIKLAVINALARMPSPETLSHIFTAFERDTGFTVQAYFNVMFSLGNRIERHVTESLKKPLPPDKLGLLVELIGAVPLRNLSEDVLALAGHPDKEIRIRVARALGKLLIPETADTLLGLASDEAWEVKAQAVKSLGKMKDLRALDVLAKSLYSPFWYVRFNAGHSLAAMGEAGLRRLKEVAGQEEDKYARDMSEMVLNDLVLPGEAA